jgi:membrane complex biogenesis BtpA family protein
MTTAKEGFLNKGVIAMVHLDALPGTPGHKKPLRDVVAKAVAEAAIYRSAGVDAIMLENMHDVPYVSCGRIGPEITAAMAVAGAEVRRAVGPALPLGVQVLAANNREAVAVALAASLDFVRVEGFVFGHVADEGYIDGCAGDLLRYRRAVGAQDAVRVFADIKKKHSSHAITADVDIAETAKAAEYFLADGVIVTGAATGCEADEAAVQRVRKAVRVPVLVGSGCTPENAHRYLQHANSLIVGSYFKEAGHWENPVVPARVTAFMDAVHAFTRQ